MSRLNARYTASRNGKHSFYNLKLERETLRLAITINNDVSYVSFLSLSAFNPEEKVKLMRLNNLKECKIKVNIYISWSLLQNEIIGCEDSSKRNDFLLNFFR